MADDDSSTSGQILGLPDWQRKVEAVILEANPQKRSEMLKAAKAAILLRQQALADGPSGHAERQSIQDALHALRMILREKRD